MNPTNVILTANAKRIRARRYTRRDLDGAMLQLFIALDHTNLLAEGYWTTILDVMEAGGRLTDDEAWAVASANHSFYAGTAGFGFYI